MLSKLTYRDRVTGALRKVSIQVVRINREEGFVILRGGAGNYPVYFDQEITINGREIY